MTIFVIGCFPTTLFAFACLLCCPVLLKVVWIADLFLYLFFYLLQLMKGHAVLLIISFKL